MAEAAEKEGGKKGEDGTNDAVNNETVVDIVAPSITKDPRFRAGCRLIQSGRAQEGSVEIFATLVEEARNKYGDNSIETAPAYYEYGNALFRSKLQQLQQEEEGEQEQEADEEEGKQKHESRLLQELEKKKNNEVDGNDKRKDNSNVSQVKNDNVDDSNNDNFLNEGGTGDGKEESSTEKKDANESKPKNDNNSSGETDDDDIELALEMMENGWSILEEYLQQPRTSPAAIITTTTKYMEWVTKIQQTRNLLGIGDVLSQLQRHADASDAYSRALSLREAELKKYHSSDNNNTDNDDTKNNKNTIQHLICQRRISEANILIAEELLSCPENQDVVTTETKECITKASERIEYARGYYDKARDELQETVYLMGKIAATAATADALKEEKENICFLATLVMGVGTRLAEYDDDDNNDDDGPKTKRLKTG